MLAVVLFNNFLNKAMKTKSLNRKAIEHLITIGYSSNEDLNKLSDAPYLIIAENEIIPCYSNSEFNNVTRTLKTQEQILKLRPKTEQTDFKKLSKKEQQFYALLKRLNTVKISRITGYDVSWAIQKAKYEDFRWEILPISPHACGSISMEHLEVVLNFAKEHNWLNVSIGYTDWNEEKKRYGTSTPCIRVS